MALGKVINDSNRIWLSINNGKVERNDNGVKTQYSYVEGRLTSVYTKERNYNGEKVVKWFIELTDEEGSLYAISLPYSSGTYKSIILSLASDEDLNKDSIIRIEPYIGKNGYTKIVVWSDGVKLDWATHELPPVEDVVINGRTYKDDSKRMDMVVGYTNQVLQRIQA